MLAAVFAMSAYAAPTLLWEFGTDTGIEDNMGANSAAHELTYGAESFYHIFTATGGDPHVSMDFSADDVSQVFWVKARVLNKSYATAIELFGATDGRGLAGPECTHIDILPNSDVWQTVIVDIPASNIVTVNTYKAVDPLIETYWSGTLDWIRLDAMWSEGDDGADSGGSMVDGEQIYIDYIAFFATEADAIAYVGTEEQTAAPAAEEAADNGSAAENNNTIIYIIIAAAAVAVVIIIIAVIARSKKKTTKK